MSRYFKRFFFSDVQLKTKMNKSGYDKGTLVIVVIFRPHLGRLMGSKLENVGVVSIHFNNVLSILLFK